VAHKPWQTAASIVALLRLHQSFHGSCMVVRLRELRTELHIIRQDGRLRTSQEPPNYCQKLSRPGFGPYALT
jgi:hypothetical protein